MRTGHNIDRDQDPSDDESIIQCECVFETLFPCLDKTCKQCN